MYYPLQSQPGSTNGVEQPTDVTDPHHQSRPLSMAATLPPHMAPPGDDKLQRAGSFDRHASQQHDKHDKDGKKRHSVFGGLFKKDKDKKDKKKDKH